MGVSAGTPVTVAMGSKHVYHRFFVCVCIQKTLYFCIHDKVQETWGGEHYTLDRVRYVFVSPSLCNVLFEHDKEQAKWKQVSVGFGNPTSWSFGKVSNICTHKWSFQKKKLSFFHMQMVHLFNIHPFTKNMSSCVVPKCRLDTHSHETWCVALWYAGSSHTPTPEHVDVCSVVSLHIQQNHWHRRTLLPKTLASLNSSSNEYVSAL